NFVLAVQTDNGGNRYDGASSYGAAAGNRADVGIGKKHVVDVQVDVEGAVVRRVVHIVALNPFVHGSEAAAKHCFSTPSEVEGDTDARTECVPGIVDQAFWNAILPGDADTIQVERDGLERRHGARTKTGAGRRNHVEVCGSG